MNQTLIHEWPYLKNMNIKSCHALTQSVGSSFVQFANSDVVLKRPIHTNTMHVSGGFQGVPWNWLLTLKIVKYVIHKPGRPVECLRALATARVCHWADFACFAIFNLCGQEKCKNDLKKNKITFFLTHIILQEPPKCKLEQHKIGHGKIPYLYPWVEGLRVQGSNLCFNLYSFCNCTCESKNPWVWVCTPDILPMSLQT